MVPLEAGVAEERRREGGHVGVQNAFRKRFAHSFPARRLLPRCYARCIFILAMVLSACLEQQVDKWQTPGTVDI